MTSPEQQQIFLLSTLIQLEKEIRHAETPAELAFIMVNGTLRLIKYRQAILWLTGSTGKIRIEAVSGVDMPDKHSPFINYLQGLLKHLAHQPENRKIYSIKEPDLKEEYQNGWQEWRMGNALWTPLITPNGELPGGLLFIRSTAWEQGEIALMERLTDAYAHAWWALKQQRTGVLKFHFSNLKSSGWQKRLLQISLIIILILSMFLPVRLSVLASVEIIPFEPFIVSAPMDGVIQQFYVKPNQSVTSGQLLFNLDDTGLSNEYEVSKKALEVARTEYERSRRKALTGDEKSRSDMAILKAQIAQKSAEVGYMADLLQRSKIYAEQNGIAVFADVNDWLGKPVAVGEKVMTIADPNRVEAEIWLPVEDAINLNAGAEVKIFLNVKPDNPIPARLRQASYEAQVTPEGILAFRLKASLVNQKSGIRSQESGARNQESGIRSQESENINKHPRIGLRGTAKIYGKEVTLFYYLMRRPMTALRQTFGF